MVYLYHKNIEEVLEMFYVGNAISFQSLQWDAGTLFYRRITTEKAREMVTRREPVSYVGHADVARIISVQLGTEIKANRVNVELRPGDVVLLAQYVGPRLPEGATELPSGARIEFIFVSISTWNPVETEVE
jgi:hypothetical protein